MSGRRVSGAAAVAVAAALAAGVSGAAAQEPLADGIYKVLRIGTQRVQITPIKQGEAALIYDHRYFEPVAGRPDQMIAVVAKPDVALELEERPQPLEDDAGRPGVRLRLNARAAAAFEEFTASSPGARFAVVVDGEVVTVYKVRGPISGGELVVEDCRPVTCDFLRQQLADNVRPSAPGSAGE